MSSNPPPASASVTEHAPSAEELSWGEWRNQHWDILQGHCQLESDSSASTGTLLGAVTSDLVRLSELLKEATAMRDRLKQLKEWEQSAKRTAFTSLADPLASHPLETITGVSPITPPSSSPEPRARAPSNASRPASNRSGSSTSKSQRRTKPKSQHHRKPTPSQGTSAFVSEATLTLGSSSSAEPIASSSSQAQADDTAQRRGERAERKIQERRRMTRRTQMAGRAAKADFDRRWKESEVANLMDARAKSNAGSGSASTGRSWGSAYARSEAETGGSSRTNPAMESGNPVSKSFTTVDASEENEAYQRVWKHYTSQWAKIAESSTPASGNALYTFETFPWPTLKPPTDLVDLNHDSIRDFIHHASAASHMGTADLEETKLAVRDARLAWHTDRDDRWIAHVEESEREDVRHGAGKVIRILNDLAKRNALERSEA